MHPHSLTDLSPLACRYMTPLEGILVVVCVITLVVRWQRPRHRQTTASALAMIGIFFVLHLFVDGVRWEMLPTYGMAVVAAVVLGGDLRRLATAKAGESAQWKKFPSPARRVLTGIALLVATPVAVLLPALLFPRVTFPRPDGPYPVGRVDVYWVDSTRDEVLTPESGDKRGVLVSIWYPAQPPVHGSLRYHPHPVTLASDMGARIGMPGFTLWNLSRAGTHSAASPSFNQRQGRAPLLLFSHGFGGTRMQNTFEFEQLASHGYVVASVEHPYSSVGTVLPDGRHDPLTTAAMMQSDTGRRRLLGIWTADMRFALDRLTSGKTHDAADSVTGHLQVDRVGVFGHSFGGAAAAETVARDQRVKAGIDMDGPPAGVAARDGLDRPFLVFRSGHPNPDSLPDAVLERRYGTTSRDSVRAIYRRFDARVNSLLQFGGTEVRMDGTAHLNFSDMPLWSPFLMRRLGLVGSDDITDVHAAITALTMRFFDQYLREREPNETVALPPHVQVRVVPHQSRVR